MGATLKRLAGWLAAWLLAEPPAVTGLDESVDYELLYGGAA